MAKLSYLNNTILFFITEPGVPYNITIGAVNEVGQGMNVSVLAFSSIQSKSHILQ